MKLRKQTTNFFTQAVLASTVFCLSPLTSHAVLVNLDAGANGQNSTNVTYPPTDGYDFTAANVTFSIVNLDNIGATAGVSVDNVGGFANDVLNFQGTSTVAGNVGPTNGIGTINLQGGAGAIVSFNGTTLTPGSGGLNFTGNGQATLTDGLTLTGNVNSTVAGQGVLLFSGSGTVTGTIGATQALNVVTLTGAGDTVTFQQSIKTVNGLQFVLPADASSTAKFSDGVTITGPINSITGFSDSGNLVFLGAGTVTGNIGDTDPLNQINLTGTSKTVNFNGDVTLDGNINFATGSNTGSIATLSDGKTLTGGVDNTTSSANIGTFRLIGSGTITGDIGETKSLLQLTINSGASATETVTLTGAIVNAATILVNDDAANGSTLVLDKPAMVLTGNITTKTTNLNTLDINDANTLNGNIGTTTNRFNLVTVAANNPLTINGNVFTKTLNFAGDNAVTLTSGKNIVGDVKTALAGTGTLIFAGNSLIDSPIGVTGTPLKSVQINGPLNTTVTLSDNITALNTSVNNGGTLLVTGPHTIDGNLEIINSSILSLGNAADPLSITGTFDLAANSRLTLDLANTVSAGEIIAAGTANVDPNAMLTLLKVPMVIADGTNIIPVVTGAFGSTLSPIDVTNNDSLLLNFSTSVNLAGTQLSLVINSVPVANFANQTNTIGIARALDAIVDQTQAMQASVGGVLGAVVDQLATFQDAGTLNQSLAELAPTVSGSFTQGSFNRQFLVGKTIVEHLGHAPYSPPEVYEVPLAEGYNSGDFIGPEFGTWIEFIGEHGHQKNRDGILGYDDKTFGVIMGIDLWNSACTTLGVAGSWTSSQIDEKISEGSSGHADSYQFTLYGQYAPDNPFYINWLGAFAFNHYSTNRNVHFGDLYLQPSGHFQGYQYGGQTEMGYDYVKDCIHTIPLVSVFYSNLLLKKYTEHGVGNAAQTIQHQHYNALLGGVGLKFAYDALWCEVMFQPEIHIRAFYDFQDDRIELTSQFLGAGPSFVTAGIKPPRDSYNIGASLKTLSINRRLIFTVYYDFNFKEDYTAHAGFLRLRYEW